MPRRRRSGALTTFAVMNFIVGGFLLLCAVCSGVDTTVTVNNQDVTHELKAFLNQRIPGYTVYKVGGAVLGFLLSVGLIVGGVGLLKPAGWGRVLCMVSAGLAIVHHIGLVVLQFFYVNPALDQFFGRFAPINLSFIAKGAGWAGIIFQLAAMIFYLLELVLLPMDKSFSGPYVDDDDEEDVRRRRRSRRADDRFDDEDEDDRRRGRRSRSDEDDDDRPRRPRSRAERDDDDEDEEERPRRRPRPRE